MMYTKVEIAIILNNCNTIKEVKRTSFWLRDVMFYEDDQRLMSHLRTASILMFNRLIK